MRVNLASLLARLPAARRPEATGQELQRQLASDQRKIIVLDDDPTGIQTVHDVPVYTGWELPQMEALFRESSRLCFVLTNTRAMSAQAAATVIRQITERVCAVSRRSKVPFSIISRGDSTLRGHWPLENSVARSVIEQEFGAIIDGEILLPCFFEGGRFTWNDTHWVTAGDQLLPVGSTEFALDRTFAYRSSDLRHWVAEKTGGRVPSADVLSISVEQLRTGGPDAVTHILAQASHCRRIVVNALDYGDLRTFALGLLRAEACGKHFLLQSAASFLKVRGGIVERPLLDRADLIAADGQGGLVIVGSHVAKTNRQLTAALRLNQVQAIELNVSRLLGTAKDEELGQAQSKLEQALRHGQTALVFTSRTVLTETNESSEANLQVAGRVSVALVALLQRLTVKPGFLISKGGITSSDVGTHGLGVRRALAAGQARPGIPVWFTGAESKFPYLPLIIFPGNVGEDTTLAELVAELAAK